MPDFIDISNEFDDDCGDACKIWWNFLQDFLLVLYQ
jgi:hypothetical protein